MANLSRLAHSRIAFGDGTGTGGAASGVALNAAFVNATSGPAVTIRYVAQTADTIDELYVFVQAEAGTTANITMQAEIFNEHATNGARAGTTSRDTSTAMAAWPGATKWLKFTFGTPYTPTVGEILWIVVSGTSGATDYGTIRTATTMPMTIGIPNRFMFPYTTADGFSSNGAPANECPFVVKQGSNYFGNPFTDGSNTYYTSNTLERGIQFTTTEDVTVVGAVIGGASAGLFTSNASNLNFYNDSAAPGGTAWQTYDLDSDTNETTGDVIGVKVFDTALTLVGGTTYKVTITFSAAIQTPSVMQIEDYATYSSVFDTLRAENPFLPWGVIDNGAGGWTTDKSICPSLILMVGDHPAISSGGGGYGSLIAGGMVVT